MMKVRFYLIFAIILIPNFFYGSEVFNPQKLAAAETKAWEAYYMRNNLALIEDLTQMISLLNNLPTLKTLATVTPKVAFAMTLFKNMPDDSTQEQYDAEVLPILTEAYESLKRSINAPWNAQQVAQADLNWWIFRRNAATDNPESVGNEMSKYYILVYGEHDDNHFLRAAYLRAVAAHYRDLCKNSWGNVKKTDWKVIEGILVQSYFELSLGIESNNSHKAKTR